MSITVSFTSSSKKINSTTQLVMTDSYECVFKSGCSMLRPTLLLEITTNTFPAYTAFKIENRYYNVTDIRSVRQNLFEVDGIIDVLATHKSAIGSSTQYVVRSSSTFNEYVMDTKYPATADTDLQTVFLNGLETDIEGTYVVGIIGIGESQNAVKYYAFPAFFFSRLLLALFDEGNLDSTQYFPLEIQKELFNPFQYIVSCMWFPFSVSDIQETSQVSTIPLGWWEYPGFGGSPVHKVAAQIVSFGQNGTIVSHPMAETRGVYLNYAPFTRRYLIGVCGCIPLDTSLFGLNDRIHVTYDIDLITGSCRFEIGCYRSTDDPATIIQIARREFLIGVPIQLAQVGTDYLGIATAAIDTAAGVAGGLFSLNFAGAASAAAHGIYDTVKTSMPQMETGGSNGSFLCMDDGLLIVSQFFIPVDEDISHRGRPLCANVQLNRLNGFILCAEGETDIPCTAEEKQLIAGFLTGGFFME